MFTKLRLERFKSFKDAELTLGPFTVLVGANATGKSNIRDAFRFLHGISRGYSVAEILGEKWVEGGFLQWSGIRGGVRETTHDGSTTFRIQAQLEPGLPGNENSSHNYVIEIATPRGASPYVTEECLLDGVEGVFSSRIVESESNGGGQRPYNTIIWTDELGNVDESVQWPPHTSVLGLLVPGAGPSEYVDTHTEALISEFRSLRFIDFVPESMRRPSLPGQTTLGDRGENLSSVLQAIDEDPEIKPTFIEWLRELTPMDVVDFEFPSDLQGKVLVTLIEANGRKISAYSASDGTLRFLGMLAALLGPEAPRFFFLEEIENGIHPSRLHLLIQLIEQVTAERGIQVVATTHSPLVLTLLSEQSLDYASVTYRLEGQPDTRIRRLLDIPHAREVLAKSSAAHLHESGWFEDALSFTEGDPEQEHAA